MALRLFFLFYVQQFDLQNLGKWHQTDSENNVTRQIFNVFMGDIIFFFFFFALFVFVIYDCVFQLKPLIFL